MPPQSQAASLQIAQLGYDTRNCPDWAYLFNSNWPNLAIAYETTVTATGFDTVVAHNLGFPPLVMAWYTAQNVSWGRMPGSDLEVDPQNINIFADGQFTLRAYNIDISKEATYALPQGANAKLPYNNQFGAKIIKNNRNIQSNNLNDFVLHTRAQSPAVLDVATQSGKYYLTSSARHYWPYGNIPPGGWNLIVYPLQTSYIPWSIGAIGLGGGSYQLSNGSGVYFDASTNSLVVNITESGGIGSLIVLRDPLFYPNVTQVVY